MRKLKLLLVDDEADYVRTMAERMELRDVGSRVALSGEEALRMVQEDTPDVMILDLRMPGIDGMAVLERVKQTHPHVQIIILTGHGSDVEEREARRLGAFEYLQKPTDTVRLLATVRSAWRKRVQFLKESRDELDRSVTAAAPPLKVLYVDDEEDYVRTMAERMEMRSLGGDVALSGEAALRMLEGDVPDVMVLDLRMPGLDGLEVLRRVRATYPQVAVIVMTDRGTEQDEARAMALGAFAYLTKPVDINHLTETIRAAAWACRGAA